MTQATPSNYWISNTALYITLNAMGDVNKLQAYSTPGAVIMCYVKGISGLEYDNGHNYQRWSLKLYPTVLSDSTAKYIYIAIPRPTATTVDTSTAIVTFPSEVIDIYGQNEAGEQIGSNEYYYINTEGVIAASVDDEGNAINRVWTTAINFGLLSTDEAYDSNTDGWWEYDSSQDGIKFLKTIISAVFTSLTATTATITNLVLGGAKFVGKAIYTALTDTTDNTVVTPKFLSDRETDIENKYIRKDQEDTTTRKLTLANVDVKSLLKVFNSLQSNGFVDDMSTGHGWGVDVNGNMQVESLEVRSALRVLELVYNRLSAEESEYVFTESGTIEEVTTSGSSYICKIKKRTDTDFHGFHKGDILRGIVNDLTDLGGGTYYTSWVLVTDTDTSKNTITVTVYDDADVPAGANFAPAEMMVLQRWGNNVSPSAETHAVSDYASFITQKTDGKWINTRQSCFYISSIEKRIAILDGVDQPILSESNYASYYGLPYGFDTDSSGNMVFKGHTLDATQPYLYVRGAFLQDIYRIDYQGNIMKEERFRGTWDSITASLPSTDPDYDPYIVTETTYDTVYHNNCKWQCSGTEGTPVTEEPSATSTKWVCLQEALKGTDAIDYECDFDLQNLMYGDDGNFVTDSVILSFFKNESDTRSAFSVSKVEMQLKKANGTYSTYSITEKSKSTYTLQPSALLTDDDLASDFLSLEVSVVFTDGYSKTFLLGIIAENQQGPQGDSAVQYLIASDYTYITIGTDGTSKTPSSAFNLSFTKMTGATPTIISMGDDYLVDGKYLQMSIDGGAWSKMSTSVVSAVNISAASSGIRLRLCNQNVSTDTSSGLIIYASLTIPVLSSAMAPQISDDGKWIINGEETEFTALGDDGHTPYIQDGYWYEWNDETSSYQNTNIKAEGVDGADGIQSNIFGYDTKLYTGIGSLVHTKTGFAGIVSADTDGNIFLNAYKDANGAYFPLDEKIAVSCTIKVTDVSSMPSSFPIALSIQGGTGTKIYDQVTAACGTEYSLAVNGAFTTKEYFPYLILRTGVSGAQALVEVTDFKIEYAENLVGVSTPFTGLADDSIVQQPNLLIDTLFTDSSKWQTFKGAKVSNLHNGVDGYQWSGSIDAGAEFDCLCQNITGKLKVNTWYTFSYYSKLDGGNRYQTFIYPGCTDTTKVCIQDDVATIERSDTYHNVETTDSSTAWKRHTVTFRTPSSLKDSYFILFRISNADGTSAISPTFSLVMPKLEECEKATAWQLNEADRKGDTGDSTISINNENQADQLPTDSDGKVVTATSISCVVYMEVGSSIVSSIAPSISEVALAGIAPTITTSGNKHTLTWTFGTDFTATADRYSVSIPITYNQKQYTTLFTLAIVKSGEKGVSPTVYNLAPTMSAISFAKSSDGSSLTPSSVLVGCGYTKNSAGVITSYAGTSMANLTNIGGKYTIYRRFILADGTYSTWSQLYNFSSTSYKVKVNSTDTYTAVEFALSSSSSYSTVADTNIIDRQTVQINKDGVDGNDAKLLTLSADRTIIACDKDWVPVDDTDITVTANLINISGTVSWDIDFDGDGDDADYRTISGNTVTIGAKNFCEQFSTCRLKATIDSYSAEITIGMVSDGATGSAGKSAKPLRVRTWKAGETYQGGATTDTYQDIVMVEGIDKEMYLCHYTHTADSTNNPDNTDHQSPSSWSASKPWSVTDYVDFTATKVLLAQKSKIENLQVDDVLIEDTDGNVKVRMNSSEIFIDATIVTPSVKYDTDNVDPVIIDVNTNRSITINAGCQNRMVVLPLYASKTMVDGTVIPSYTQDGAHIYINVQNVPHLTNWRYFNNEKYNADYMITKEADADAITGLWRDKILGYLAEGAVLVCADAMQLYATTSNVFEHSIAGCDPTNSKTYLQGRFSVNGATARFIILMPGQTLSLRSAVETYIDENYDEGETGRETKYLTWYVENGSELVNLSHRMYQDTDHYYDFKAEPTTIDQTDDAFFHAQDWQDMIFGAKVFDANLYGTCYGAYSYAKTALKYTPHIMLTRCATASDDKPYFSIQDYSD